MSEFIYTEQRDQVLLLQIRYEQTLNCLNNEILKEIAGILREFSRDPGLRVVIVTGTGRSFCTGADLKAFTRLSQEDCVDYCMDYEEDIFHILSASRKLSIAAVNGYAMGGGMELALACDFRIGVPKTQFAAPEYGFGWVPGWGGVHRLGKLLGSARAKEVLFLKEKLRAEKALELGLLSEIVENPDDLVERAFAIGEQLAGLNPLTVTYTKTILNDFDVPVWDSLAQGLVNGITSKSVYAREQVEAFFNRKK
ncbi:MAG: enoyl-CoA hydratase/isomerase family protein [Lachnospiraceae bacterium]|nr:enoyl-CoA hydratase/isomerase family protein [Lachnospiraceae bacterium]